MKPIVRYTPIPDHDFIEAGYRALVLPVDHPSPYVSNTRSVSTSRVLSHNKDTGEFETLNTIYKPVGLE